MRAIVATAEGPSWTERREVPAPAPAANEALIAVRAFAVNRGELTLVRRRDGWQPGQDVAGEVLRPAADGSGPRAGERVAGLAEWHGWAEEAVVPAHRLAPGPGGGDLEGAAALTSAGWGGARGEATIRTSSSARHEAEAGRVLQRLLHLVAGGRLRVE